MGLEGLVSDDEIRAYEVVRQRLRRLAAQHPAIMEMPIAWADRKCPICGSTTVVEHPNDGFLTESFTCRTCQQSWSPAQSVSHSWLKIQRAQWREEKRVRAV